MLRKVTVGAAALLFAGSSSMAAELSSVETLHFADPSTSAAPVTITQNLDTTTLIGTVACGSAAGGYTTENSYTRRFFLTADHGITDVLTVSSVEIGISQIDFVSGAVGVDVPYTINIYSIAAGDAFLFANLTLVGTADNVTNSDDLGMLVSTAVGGAVDPSSDDLVVECFTPTGELGTDGSGADPYQFRPGANDGGYVQESYLASDSCAITEPTPVSAIGFEDSQFVMIVSGDTEGDPTPTEEKTWSAVKSLF